MIEEVVENIYKIEIPLPNSPLKFINSYLIKAPERNLIIDTGMNRKECLDEMVAGLRELEVDLTETDFFITHFHVDHLGLVSSLLTQDSMIYFNQPEADRLERIRSGSVWPEMIDFTRSNGFPDNELEEILHHHPGYKYLQLRDPMPFHFLGDGDTLHVGDYRFNCVETPGHSKGHRCLYDPRKRIFFAGDHILNGLTPNISLRSAEENPLRDYLASLDKVYPLEIELVLPGHGSLFKNFKTRIGELKQHHQERADEVTSILRKGNKNAYEVASEMSWEISCDRWDLFPTLQKWFAVGEAMAHLRYLEDMGRAQKGMEGQKIVYSPRE